MHTGVIIVMVSPHIRENRRTRNHLKNIIIVRMIWKTGVFFAERSKYIDNLRCDFSAKLGLDYSSETCHFDTYGQIFTFCE